MITVPTAERPREKLLAMGGASLNDAELLAIFLRTGIRGLNAVDLARQLITRFGGLRELVGMPASTLCDIPGLGPAKVAQIAAALEMSRRVMEQSMREQNALTHPEQARRYLSSQLAHQRREVFACLFLDTRHRVICYEELFHGTLDGAPVYPREVIRRAIEVGAGALIFAHNHPSGDPEPSSADITMTQRLKTALALVDIRVLDHLIIGHGRVVSLAERGQI